MNKNAQAWKCEFCGQSFIGRKAFFQHNRVCEERLKQPRDSLGRIIKPEQSHHKILNYKPHKMNNEARKNISAGRIKFLETHPNHGVKWYEVNGIKVQGTWEKQFAEYLTEQNISWKRGPKLKFLNTHSYTPDFYCPEQDIYFEVKGFRRDRDIFKMHLVLKEHPGIKIKMIEKNQLENLSKIDPFSLPNFEELYPLKSISMSNFTNYWANVK